MSATFYSQLDREQHPFAIIEGVRTPIECPSGVTTVAEMVGAYGLAAQTDTTLLPEGVSHDVVNKLRWRLAANTPLSTAEDPAIKQTHEIIIGSSVEWTANGNGDFRPSVRRAAMSLVQRATELANPEIAPDQPAAQTPNRRLRWLPTFRAA